MFICFGSLVAILPLFHVWFCVLAFYLPRACVLPLCPPLIRNHFVAVAMGDQMANWALCHVTSLHWGVSQSAQARLFNRRLHSHRSPILTESSFRGPEGPFHRLKERERVLLHPIWHQATRLCTFAQPECFKLCVFGSERETHVPAVCWLNPVRVHVFMTPLLADTFRVRFKAGLEMLCSKLTRALCQQAPDWLCIPWHWIRKYTALVKNGCVYKSVWILTGTM